MAERRGVAVVCIGCGGELGGDEGDRRRRRCTCDEEHGRSRAHVETYEIALTPKAQRSKAN